MMLEPLLLTVAVITVPFGLYLAFDRKSTEQQVERRVNRHERARETLRRLAQREAHWDLNHLRFELRQNYRTIQKARQSGAWDALADLVCPTPLNEWRIQWERRQEAGIEWKLDPLEILDVQPVNLQNRAGFEHDFITVEIQTRRREYLLSPQGVYREGSGLVGESVESIPIEIVSEYWTFIRKPDSWMLTRCDRQLPDNLAFINEESGSLEGL
jgi:hypothetical protein